MIRKFKMLGMALAAVLALTAVAASAASAEKQYTASTYPTTGTGESALGNDVFNTEAGPVECKSHFKGTLSAPSSDLSVVAHYTECKAFFFLNATVSDCNYTFTTPSTAKDEKGNVIPDVYTAKVDVTNTCTIVAATCEVKVEPQGPLGSVTITDDTAAGDVTVKANVTGIAYNVIKDGIGCPFSSTGKKAGATYTQGSAITFDAVSPVTATIDVG